MGDFCDVSHSRAHHSSMPYVFESSTPQVQQGFLAEGLPFSAVDNHADERKHTNVFKFSFSCSHGLQKGGMLCLNTKVNMRKVS